MPVNTDTRSAAAENESDSPKTLDLSVTQVVGGALAAMTAAFLGSRLSVAGTVIGAAVASIIAAIAGSLYTASLQHTRDKVRSVWAGTTKETPTRVEVITEDAARAEATAAPAVEARPEPFARRPASVPAWWRSGRLWKRILVGALVTFALAAGAVTGLELVSGQALSGGSGTTVERVREPGAGGSSTDEQEPSASPSDESSETPDPSTDESSEPSSAPSSESVPETSDAPSEPSEPSAAETGPAAPAETGGQADPGTGP